MNRHTALAATALFLTACLTASCDRKTETEDTPAPPTQPTQPSQPAGPHPFDSELKDTGQRVRTHDFELRFDDGGIIFEKSDYGRRLRVTRLSDGLTVTFSFDAVGEDGTLASPRFSVNGTERPLSHASNVATTLSSVSFFNLTDAATGTQTVIVCR